MSTDYPTGPDNAADHGSERLQDQARSDLRQVSSKSGAELDAATRRAGDDLRELGHQAEEKIGEATAHAKSFADHQKNLAANQINGVATAIAKVADELDSSDQQVVARYARDLAQGLSRVGQQVEQRDTDDLMGAAEDFGRKQPLAFLGAAALTGFVASRFALASAHRRNTKAAGQPAQPSSSNATVTTGNAGGA